MICKLCLPLICINSTWLVFIVFLWFISPLWEMSQEGIDIKTIQWSQHWSPRCAHSTQTPHLYLAQQCCVEGGLIVLLYPHSYQFLSRYSESFVVSWTSEDFMEYLLNSHFLRTKWFICVRIFDIYFIVPVKSI